MIFPNPLIFGSRASPLALLQTEIVKKKIIEAFPDQYNEKNISIKTFNTKGDKILNQRLVDFGGKGLFTKELEEALLNGEIHCAIHSTKDMATTLPENLKITAYLSREDARDALISKNNLTLDQLPQGAIVGTASLRRSAQLLQKRPDIKTKLIRGNIDTRLKKLQEEEYDAIILAYAGLIRANKTTLISEILNLDTFLPAVAQGVICIETLRDSPLDPLFERIKDIAVEKLVILERLFLKNMDGSCKTPIACHARYLPNDQIHFRGEIYRHDGSEKFSIDEKISCDKAIEKVNKLSENLKLRIPKEVFLYE